MCCFEFPVVQEVDCKSIICSKSYLQPWSSYAGRITFLTMKGQGDMCNWSRYALTAQVQRWKLRDFIWVIIIVSENQSSMYHSCVKEQLKQKWVSSLSSFYVFCGTRRNWGIWTNKTMQCSERRLRPWRQRRAGGRPGSSGTVILGANNASENTILGNLFAKPR